MSYFGITEEEIREKLNSLKIELKSSGTVPSLNVMIGPSDQNNHATCQVCHSNRQVGRYQGCKTRGGRLYICHDCSANASPSEGAKCWQCKQPALQYGRIAICSPYEQYSEAKKNTVAIDVIDQLSKRLIPSKRTSNSKAKKAQPYIDSGLAEPFAMAIIEGTDDDEVLTLWEADWWKQYPAEDILIVSVLSGQHTESDGKYMNSIRSNHERLSLCCVVKDVTIDWARALLESGFDDHPEAVNSVLDGGEPRIVARIRKMKVNSDTLPTGLGKSVSTLEKLKPESNDDVEEEDEEIDDSDED